MAGPSHRHRLKSGSHGGRRDLHKEHRDEPAFSVVSVHVPSVCSVRNAFKQPHPSRRTVPSEATMCREIKALRRDNNRMSLALSH